jgi:hypothetical protein
VGAVARLEALWTADRRYGDAHHRHALKRSRDLATVDLSYPPG